MRKLLGLFLLPLLPLVWIADLPFSSYTDGGRESPWRYALGIWDYWKLEFWNPQSASRRDMEL